MAIGVATLTDQAGFYFFCGVFFWYFLQCRLFKMWTILIFLTSDHRRPRPPRLTSGFILVLCCDGTARCFKEIIYISADERSIFFFFFLGIMVNCGLKCVTKMLLNSVDSDSRTGDLIPSDPVPVMWSSTSGFTTLVRTDLQHAVTLDTVWILQVRL